MNYLEQDLWSNGKGAPLAFLLPGGTGTRRPEMLGYNAIAAFFWLHGFSAYIFTTSGQDARPGKYGMKTYLTEATAVSNSLIDKLDPSRVLLFGSCAGGSIAAHLAINSERETVLAFWESPFHYLDSDTKAFMERAELSFVDDFVETVVHMDAALGQINCPVLIAYGPPLSVEKAIFRHDDIRQIEIGLKLLPPHQIEKLFLPDTDHNLCRGSNPQSLKTLVIAIYDFAERHKIPTTKE